MFLSIDEQHISDVCSRSGTVIWRRWRKNGQMAATLFMVNPIAIHQSCHTIRLDRISTPRLDDSTLLGQYLASMTRSSTTITTAFTASHRNRVDTTRRSIIRCRLKLKFKDLCKHNTDMNALIISLLGRQTKKEVHVIIC